MLTTIRYALACKVRGWWMAAPRELGRISVLYRLMTIAILISSILQLAYFRAPGSVSSQSPGWFDTVFMIGQLAGAVLLAIALFGGHRMDVRDASYIELMGCIFTATAGTNYVISVVGQNEGPPLTQGTWLTVVAALYTLLRGIEITRVAIVVGAIHAAQSSGKDPHGGQ